MENLEILRGPEADTSPEGGAVVLSPETQEITVAVEADLAPEIAEAQQISDPVEQKGRLAELAEKAGRLVRRYGTIAAMAAMPYLSDGAQAGEVIRVDSVAQLRAELAKTKEARETGESAARQGIDLRRQSESGLKTEVKVAVTNRELDIKEIKTIEQLGLKRTQLNQRIKESDAKITMADRRQSHKESMDYIKAARDDRKQAMGEIGTLNKIERDWRKQELNEYKTRNAERRKNVNTAVGAVGKIIKLVPRKR